MEIDIGYEQQHGYGTMKIKKREMIFAYVTPGQMMIREKCYLCERRPIEIWTPRYKVNNFFLCTVMHYS